MSGVGEGASLLPRVGFPLEAEILYIVNVVLLQSAFDYNPPLVLL